MLSFRLTAVSTELKASLAALVVKNLPVNVEDVRDVGVQSLDQEDPLEKDMATHSSILAGESHGQRSLEGYSSWGHKESNTTERLTLSLCIKIIRLSNQSTIK